MWVVVLVGGECTMFQSLGTCREPMEHKALSWVLWSVVTDSDFFQVTVAQSNQLGDERHS